MFNREVGKEHMVDAAPSRSKKDFFLKKECGHVQVQVHDLQPQKNPN